jgi:hypothetical protein
VPSAPRSVTAPQFSAPVRVPIRDCMFSLRQPDSGCAVVSGVGQEWLPSAAVRKSRVSLVYHYCGAHLSEAGELA